MARNFSPVADEIQVNLNPNQNLYQLDPDVAVLTDGRFFVAFEDNDVNFNIIGQFVNPDGTHSGSNINIDIGAGDQFDPAVAQRSGGAAIVVWEDNNTSDDIQYSIISSAGVAGAEQTILSGNALEDPDVATLADGRSLVVAQQTNASDDIVFRFVEAGGTPSAALQDFIDNGAGFQFDPAVAAFANNALVVYEDETATPGDADIQARFFNGSSFATEVTIADNLNSLDNPDVAALTDGRFIVVWDDNETDQIQGRFVSGAGVPLGSAFVISDAGGDNENARVAALPDGGFVVTWNNNGGLFASEADSDNTAIVARRFDSGGAPAGDLFLVNTGDSDTGQYLPAVAANPATGQAFITWEDEHIFSGAGGDPEPAGIRGRAFLATTDTVNGTEGPDFIQTFSLSESINGLGGDDTINGLAGNDIILGGAGFDQIAGGGGNDQLFGEADDDLLKGEDGDDLLVGGLGRDVQLGGAGRDVFDFNAAAESRGFNRDVIVGFSRTEDDRIDLTTIDAETGGGNQKFHFIGKDTFSGEKGELRFAGGVLQGDTDGNGTANFAIKITGLGASAESGDFFL